MLIFIYFILKLFFAHIIFNIKKLNAFMHIIGKISEENLIYFLIYHSLAQIGKGKNLFYNMKKDENVNNNECIVMGGNNYYTIHLFIKYTHEFNMGNDYINHVHIFILYKTRGLFFKIRIFYRN